MKTIFKLLTLSLPPEWAQMALVLSLLSVGLVIGLFVYLHYRTRNEYLKYWTAAWLFYAVYLAAAISLEETPAQPFLVMVRRACVGISGLLMFWGCFNLINAPRSRRELGLSTLLMVIWSYVAAYQVRSSVWITAPVFTLLASAAIATGIYYIRHRPRSQGATILGIGFFCWSLHLWASPFLNLSVGFVAFLNLTSFLATLVIATGMVIEHQITLSEKDYRSLFDAAGDAMFLVDYETQRILEVNPAGQRLAQLVGVAWQQAKLHSLFPGLRIESRAGACHVAEEAAGREVSLRRPNGRLAVYEASTSLVLSPRGAVLLVVARDITEHKETADQLRVTAHQLLQALADLQRLQQQLIQQERLEALRKMASGVAHDFNNVLARILGFVELLLTVPADLHDAKKVKEHLQMIHGTAEEAVNVVNRLREFYRHRQETEVYQPVDLNQVVAQAVELTRPRWRDQMLALGRTIHCETVLGAIPLIQGRAEDLREALLNLIFNAVEALPTGGTLRLATYRAGEQVVVEVSDTGAGMTAEVRDRCLEPFFTTKGTAGTGLGLAIVYGIIQRHHGTIEIQSEVGNGTTFRVIFPVPAQTGEPSVPARTAPARVLVVEDEPAFRDFLAQFLGGLGHAVTTASNGREALAKFQPQACDLVITDRAMPEMSGDQLIAAIRQRAPGMPVLMVTGFADLQTDDSRAAPAQPDLILRKPVTSDVLQLAITRVLGKSGTIPLK